jgi:hypothetical protein
MNQSNTAAQKTAFIEKYFSCAESPIQEWLATYVKKQPIELFPDYTGNADVVGFIHNNQQYTSYLVPMPWGTESLVDAELLKSSEKARKACSMLYDSVKEIFVAITGSFNENNPKTEEADLFKSLIPMFDNDKMAFHLSRVNWKALQLKTAHLQREQIQNYIQQNKHITDEQMTAIQQSVTNIEHVFADINDDVLDEYEEKCKDTNEKIKLYDWLHIVVEPSDPNDSDTLNSSMERLPMFGLPYQDPEEETFIETLKKDM